MTPQQVETDVHAGVQNMLQPDIVFQHITLPCGLRMQNRLVKTAMYEHLASFLGGPPNEHHFRLYSEWAKYDWGMIITGNMQVSQSHLSLGRDIVLSKSHSEEKLLHPFRRMSDCIHGLYDKDGKKTPQNHNNSLAIMQINHAGRQSTNFLGGRPPFWPPRAPSPIPVSLRSGASLASTIINYLMFQTPKAMSEAEVQEVIDAFVDGGVLAYKTGFDGVQLHAAHGYLLSQFLSPKVKSNNTDIRRCIELIIFSQLNTRVDQYSYDNSLEIIHTIVQRIRLSTSNKFAICIKINSADYISPETSGEDTLGDAEKVALKQILTMAEWGLIDVIEISGGDYENPDFMKTQDGCSKSVRQVFFARFSRQVLSALRSRKLMQVSPPLILLTGGLRTPRLLRSALMSAHADLLGVGRGSVLCPNFPSVARVRLKNPNLWDDVPFERDPSLKRPRLFTHRPFNYLWSVVSGIKIIGAGVNMSWYIVTMRHITQSQHTGPAFVPDLSMGGMQSILSMWIWTNNWSWMQYWMMVLLTLTMVIAGGTVHYSKV